MKIFFGFILCFILEIAAFVYLGKWIGFGWTLLLLLGCSVLGFVLFKMFSTQSLMQMMSISPERQVNVSPAPILDPIACLLMMIPGFVNTFLGFLLLLPFVQTWIFEHFQSKITKHTKRFYGAKRGATETETTIETEVIEGEFEKKE